MVPHLVGLPTFTRELSLHEYLKSTPPQIELPLQIFSWLIFLRASKKFTKNYFYQFLCLLSGTVLVFHYKKVLSIIGKKQNKLCASKITYSVSRLLFSVLFYTTVQINEGV